MLSDVEAGCYIDGSHMNSFDFMVAVIDFAADHGFEILRDVYNADVEAFRNDGLDEDMMIEVLNVLDWTYDDAIEYLNDNTREGFVWTVDCMCLILEELDD